VLDVLFESANLQASIGSTKEFEHKKASAKDKAEAKKGETKKGEAKKGEAKKGEAKKGEAKKAAKKALIACDKLPWYES